jgi:hypothetical protein
MLPREIQTENWPDRSKYDLPIRPIGRLRWAGLVPMAFGVLFAAFPARIGSQALSRAFHHGGTGAFEWVTVAFLSIFVVVAMVPFGFGLFVLAGRVRLVATKDKLIITEIAGPFRRSRKLRLADIERFELAARAVESQSTPGIDLGALGVGQLGGLIAVMRNGPKRVVAIGYPREWLSALAGELSGDMAQHGETVPVQEVSVALGQTAPVQNEESLSQPRHSSARLVKTGAGVELTVPSRGLFKDSAGMILFGIFWCGMLSVITSGFLFGHSSSHSHDSLGKVGTVILFALFWVVGLGVLSLGVHLGTRVWTVQADKTDLRVKLSSALRKKEWQWRTTEIQKIQVGNSNMEVNDRRLEELQVIPLTGKKTGLLVGRDHDELVWMATVIRQATGLRAQDESEPLSAPV